MMNNLSMILFAMALTSSANSKMIATKDADLRSNPVTEEIQREMTQDGEMPAHKNRTGGGYNVQVSEGKWDELGNFDKVLAEEENMFKDFKIIFQEKISKN